MTCRAARVLPLLVALLSFSTQEPLQEALPSLPS